MAVKFSTLRCMPAIENYFGASVFPGNIATFSRRIQRIQLSKLQILQLFRLRYLLSSICIYSYQVFFKCNIKKILPFIELAVWQRNRYKSCIHRENKLVVWMYISKQIRIDKFKRKILLMNVSNL